MPLTLWGNPILDYPSLPVGDDEFGPDLAELGDRMLRVMHAARGDGYLARCLQHEIDHIDGNVYLSRLGGRAGKTARAQAKQASWYGAPHRFIPIG
jgi:peptide deformylase